MDDGRLRFSDGFGQMAAVAKNLTLSEFGGPLWILRRERPQRLRMHCLFAAVSMIDFQPIERSTASAWTVLGDPFAAPILNPSELIIAL